MDVSNFDARSQVSVPGRTYAAEDVYTIGDLAREFGITLRALRFYEDKGLLSPRREGLARLYPRRTASASPLS